MWEAYYYSRVVWHVECRPGPRRQRLTRSVDAKLSAAAIQQEAAPIHEQPPTPSKTVPPSPAATNSKSKRPPQLQLAAHGSASHSTPVSKLASSLHIIY
jgi:hypothetical protein